MASVVVDANVLLAARLSRDQNHDRGNAISDAIDQGEGPTASLLNDVLEEVIAVTARKPFTTGVGESA